ncbi:hypothetical protein ACJJIX_13160 [Microbulbifer sp. VAAC004]|uniref:hypothetical protein n=1 Tax=unclassified Microbulbifer TaxID=2619833 RepID=UPI004039FCA1
MSTSKTDVAAIIGKGLVGAVPFVGPLAAEIVGSVIPNQRIDRIESLLKFLESKISEDKKCRVKERISSPESIDLIEDGFIQASRSLSQVRKDYIASLLKNSLTDDDLAHIEYKRILATLGELNDLEILMLKSYSLNRGEERFEEFWDRHGEALESPSAHIGGSATDFDKHTIYQTHKEHLINLGLLKINFKKPKRGELPEFDDRTGMMKARGSSITSYGRLLLRSIDQDG